MIKIVRSKEYLVALESVAMTDIVMNMFIFFFISFSIVYTFNPDRVAKIDIKLPKAQSAVKLEGSDKIVLTIAKNGTYFLGADRVGPSNLKSALSARLKANPNAGIILKVDSLSRFDMVARVLDIINELNVKKVSVATVKR